MKINFLSAKFLIFTFFLGLAPVLFAEDPPEVRLKNTIESVIDVLYDADESVTLAQKRDKVLGVLEQSFSFDVLVRRTLGRNWQKLNEQQQKEIISLATDLMIHTYTKEFAQGVRPTVVFEKPLELSKNKLEIASVMKLSGKKINVSYRLAKLESGWQVYDLIAEGISIVSSYRKQFDSHFLKGDGDELIDQLEAKISEL